VAAEQLVFAREMEGEMPIVVAFNAGKSLAKLRLEDAVFGDGEWRDLLGKKVAQARKRCLECEVYPNWMCVWEMG
jgi:hypothetical protein